MTDSIGNQNQSSIIEKLGKNIDTFKYDNRKASFKDKIETSIISIANKLFSNVFKSKMHIQNIDDFKKLKEEFENFSTSKKGDTTPTDLHREILVLDYKMKGLFEKIKGTKTHQALKKQNLSLTNLYDKWQKTSEQLKFELSVGTEATNADKKEANSSTESILQNKENKETYKQIHTIINKEARDQRAFETEFAFTGFGAGEKPESFYLQAWKELNRITINDAGTENSETAFLKEELQRAKDTLLEDFSNHLPKEFSQWVDKEIKDNKHPEPVEKQLKAAKRLTDKTFKQEISKLEEQAFKRKLTYKEKLQIAAAYIPIDPNLISEDLQKKYIYKGVHISNSSFQHDQVKKMLVGQEASQNQFDKDWNRIDKIVIGKQEFSKNSFTDETFNQIIQSLPEDKQQREIIQVSITQILDQMYELEKNKNIDMPLSKEEVFLAAGEGVKQAIVDNKENEIVISVGTARIHTIASSSGDPIPGPYYISQAIVKIDLTKIASEEIKAKKEEFNEKRNTLRQHGEKINEAIEHDSTFQSFIREVNPKAPKNYLNFLKSTSSDRTFHELHSNIVEFKEIIKNQPEHRQKYMQEVSSETRQAIDDFMKGYEDFIAVANSIPDEAIKTETYTSPPVYSQEMAMKLLQERAAQSL